jgi:hypothetical protein
MGVGQGPVYRGLGLTPRLVHMGFFMDVVALGQDYLGALLFSYASYCSTYVPLHMSSGVAKIGPSDVTVGLAQLISCRVSLSEQI